MMLLFMWWGILMNFECTECGLCCTAKSDLRLTVSLTDEEWKHLNDRYKPKFKWQKGFMGFEECSEGYKCKALKGTFRENVYCEIYDTRPGVCRRFENGGNMCLKIREENKVGAWQ